MKLHLPLSLLKALWIGFGAAVATLGTSTSHASGLHSQVSMVTYTDFGQNMGRYRVNGVNDLLSSIRQREGGVVITYIEGHDDYTLDHYMPSFESQGDNGAYAAVGYNFIATVAHNGCQNPTFTGRYIEEADSLHYMGVEYRDAFTFCLQPGRGINVSYAYDYKMTRLNKLVTDVVPSGLVPRFADDFNYADLHGLMEYRAGSGTMTRRELDGSITSLTGAYAYVTGAVQHITTGETTDQAAGCFTAGANFDPSAKGINEDNPLPFVGQAGDSGSPVWLWDDASQSYLYLAAYQSGSDWFGQARGSINFSWDTLPKFDKLVNMEQGTAQTVHIKGVKAQAGDEVVREDFFKDDGSIDHTYSTTLHKGRVEDGQGKLITDYVGVKGENDQYINTWLNLAEVKDNEKWYTYNEKYYNVGDYKENGVTTHRERKIEDMFFTSNLVFSASTETGNVVAVDEDTDLGVGYLQFSINPDSHLTHAEFTLQSNGTTSDGRGGQRNHMVNGAGFVVEDGVDLHVKLTNTQWDTSKNDYYYREWRKVGDGNLHLEGLGNNQIFLNVGGSGTTYLNETAGYAAYNVYVGSGSTVAMDSTAQIARDFTFGYNGGTLDIRGNNSMDWYRTNPNVSAQGFSINSLSEDAYITNSKADSTLTLTYKESGETEYLGSFVDTGDSGNVRIVFDADPDSTTTLHSIHTNLQNEGSGITVKSGTVVLEGTNTVHALGSLDGHSAARYTSAEDWHYADSATDVLVEGGTFQLGSHARLTGDVQLRGGSLVINQGVLHQYEYIEGGQRLEDTTSAFYRRFYGLHGNVDGDASSFVHFDFDERTTAEQVYTGNITGETSVFINLGGHGANLRLSGESNFSGMKYLSGGGLVSDNGLKSLGTVTDDENAWLVFDDAFIAAKGATGDGLLDMIASYSTGTLALTQDQATDLNLQDRGYSSLIVGALEGMDVHYGTANAMLATVQNGGREQWLLGGGGGNLVVDFLLVNRNAELVLGNEYTTGTVTLTNPGNDIGSISFMGRVTLDYTDERALGKAAVNLAYGNRLLLPSADEQSRVAADSQGVLLVDRVGGGRYDMSNHPGLYIGAATSAELDEAPVLAAGESYRFGGITGTLTVNTALANQNGATGMSVDGQTYSGGVLALAQAASLTGNVDVRGYDEGKMLDAIPRQGDITLRLDVQDAIASAGSVSMGPGGIIDINGTSQTLHNLTMAEGSLLTDGTAARKGSVVVDVAGGRTTRLEGSVDVARLTKTGEGNMVLAGVNDCGTFTIAGGTVTLLNGDALNASGTTIIAEGGTLDTTAANITQAIHFQGGTMLVGSTDNATLGGTLIADAGSNGTVRQATAGGSTRITANLDAAPDATLTLSGANGTFNLTGTSLNTSGGTIALEGKQLTLDTNSEVTIGGTLSLSSQGLSSGQRVTLCSGGSTDNMTRNINQLHIVDGSNAEIKENTWNTIWNIHSLTGSGDLKWTSNTTHWFSARLILDGDNDFSGSFTADRIHGNVATRPYQTYLEARHDGAMKNMDVTLNGKGAQSNMSLAVNTDNLRMKSLAGNQYTVLYAGAAHEGTKNDEGQTLVPVPTSTRNATLTITGGKSATFSGLVQGGEDGALNIVKQGGGTQTFNGSTVVVNDVSALGGGLTLNSAGLSVRGNVTIARGATLTMNRAYNLGSGKVLTVAGQEGDAAAKLAGTLTLQGGTINFSGLALNNTAAALSVNSLTGNSVNIDFSDTSALKTGTYFLAAGNWSGVTLTCAEQSYWNVTLTKNTSSLKAIFALKSGSHIWNGTADKHQWNAGTFGQDSISFGTSDTAVFTDLASGREVAVGTTRTIASLVFDSSHQYTVGNTAGNYVTAATLEQLGSGTTIVNGGLKAANIIIKNGELRVADAALLTSADSITGTGTLGLDISGATTVNGKLSAENRLGALHIHSGTYASAGEVYADNVLLDAGSTFQLQADQSANITANADGGTDSQATVALGSRTLNGRLTLAGDTTVTASGGTLAADVRTEGHLLTTAGNMTINNTALAGSLRVDSGTLKLQGGLFNSLGDITIGSGATLYFGYGNSITSGATVNLEDGAILSSESGGADNHQLTINVNVLGGTAEIQGCYNGNNLNLSGGISGNGTLKLGQNHGNSWTVSAPISDGANPGDSLALLINSKVKVSGANTYSGGTTISGGETVASNASAFGTGELTMNGGSLETTQGLRIASIGGSSGSINFNSMTLTLTGDEDASFGGAVQGTPNIVKQGGGRQAFSQAAAYGSVAVQRGTLALNATELGRQVSVGSGASLLLGGESILLHAPVYNAGEISLTGSSPVLNLATDGGFSMQGGGYIDIDGNESADGNGFLRGGSIQVVYMVEGATLNSRAAMVTYQGSTLQLDDHGTAWLGEKSSHSYSVRQGRVTYDEAFATKAATRELEAFILATALEETPAELEIIEELPQDVVIHTSGLGGILSLGKDVTLSSARLDIGAATVLNGAGRLELAAGQASLPQAVAFGPQWTGTVAVSGSSFTGAFTCASLGTADSWLELKGTKGYLNNNPTIANNLILARGEDGWAFEQNNGNDGTTVRFTGAIKGDGNIGRSNGTGSTYTYEFSGDISGWTGQFISRNGNGKYTMFRVKDEATEVNADLLLGDPNAANNDFRVEVRNDARFNGRIQANRLAVAGGANATLAGTSSFNRSVSVAEGASLVNTGHAAIGGEVSLAGAFTNEGTLNIGSVSSWSGELVNAAQGNVVLDATLATGSILNRGTITVSDLMVGPNATYRDARGRTTSGNGFATSTIEVCTVGTIRNDGGTIMYGGQDVTQTVLNTGRLVNVTNNASYRINTTDSNVAFSNIQSASDGMLEHIVFASGTSLKVDNAGGGVHLHSSQVTGATNATLQLQAGAAMVLDSGLSATMDVASGVGTLQAAAEGESASPFAITKTGDGTLRITDESAGDAPTYRGTLAINAGTVELDSQNVVFSTVSVGANTLRVTAEHAAAETVQTASGSHVTVDGGLNVATLNLVNGSNVGGSGTLDVQSLALGGDVTISGMNRMNVYGTVNQTGGTVKFGSALSRVAFLSTEGVNRFAKIDMGNSKQALAEVTFAEGTQNTANELWMNSKEGNRILLERNASLSVGGAAIKGLSAQEDAEVRLVQSGAQTQGGQYSMGSGSFRISHAEVAVDTSSGAKTIGNALQDVRLVNAGANTLTESNGANTSLAAAEAVRGDITFLNKAAGMEVQDIMLGADRTLSVYRNGTASEANETTLTIRGRLEAQGAGGTINANVVMESGSELDVSRTEGHGIGLGSTLTIKEGIGLSSSDLATLYGLAEDERYNLFTGVDELVLDTTPYQAIHPQDRIDAAGWFRGVEPQHIYMVYDGSNVGLYCVVPLPEPTTSTLSLLALAALAARRRRK